MDPPLGLNYGATHHKEMKKLLEISRQNWIQNLSRHSPSFQHYVPVPNNPAAQAWKQYQIFTRAVIKHLEDDDDYETASNLLIHGFLERIYLHTPRDFNAKWVTSAYLENPRSNSPEQIQFLAIVNIVSQRPKSPLLEKVRYVDQVVREWKEDAYALENVLVDPNPNWLFSRGHSLVAFLPESPEVQTLIEQKAECPICTDPFEADMANRKNPLQGPCKHYHCQDCFDHWLVPVSYTHLTLPRRG